MLDPEIQVGCHHEGGSAKQVNARSHRANGGTMGLLADGTRAERLGRQIGSADNCATCTARCSACWHSNPRASTHGSSDEAR